MVSINWVHVAVASFLMVSEIWLLSREMDGSFGFWIRSASRDDVRALTSGERPGVKCFLKPDGMVFLEALLIIFWKILEFLEAEDDGRAVEKCRSVMLVKLSQSASLKLV